ncbi:hypothetical protein BDW22DRAFT_1352919 [Trametopsis cervina]|nr:hypothetical protein BDW22DRAFT_1352919 [Trametopsis cervina]
MRDTCRLLCWMCERQSGWLRAPIDIESSIVEIKQSRNQEIRKSIKLKLKVQRAIARCKRWPSILSTTIMPPPPQDTVQLWVFAPLDPQSRLFYITTRLDDTLAQVANLIFKNSGRLGHVDEFDLYQCEGFKVAPEETLYERAPKTNEENKLAHLPRSKKVREYFSEISNTEVHVLVRPIELIKKETILQHIPPTPTVVRYPPGSTKTVVRRQSSDDEVIVNTVSHKVITEIVEIPHYVYITEFREKLFQPHTILSSSGCWSIVSG